MKNKIQFLQFVAILFFSFSTHSQVTVSVQNLQYTNNGQPTVYPTNCGNIDLASSTSTSINLGINLSKPNGQVVGLSDLRVYTQKSSSDYRVERSWAQIQESFWSTSVPNTYSTNANFSINSSDFNVSGGTLYVVFKSSGNVEYQTTCSYTITKTNPPTFTLSPTTLSIPCGSVAPVTFSYSNVYNTPGVTYNYSYSGWTFVSQTSNSITLKPTSGSVLPSNFSLVPIVNGVTQPYKVCTVTRTPFTSNATISGVSNICSLRSQNIYTINADAGSAVSWSSSDVSKAIVSSQSNNQATITSLANGTVTLTATITNPCGQTATKTKIISIGKPYINYVLTRDEFCNFNYRAKELFNNNSNVTFNWQYVSGTGNASSNNFYSFGDFAQFTACPPFTITLKLTATNACGSSEQFVDLWLNNDEEEIYRVNQNIKNEAIVENEFLIFPNPSSDYINIEIKNNNIDKKTILFGELFDMLGRLKTKVKIIDNKATFSVQDLNKGIYVLKIYINGQVESHQIAVE